jgi:hypothetical protein
VSCANADEVNRHATSSAIDPNRCFMFSPVGFRNQKYAVIAMIVAAIPRCGAMSWANVALDGCPQSQADG